MTCRLGVAVICSLMSASAQSTETATRELIQSLLTRIDTLEKRVAELEHERSAAAPLPAIPRPAPPAPPATDAVHAQHERTVIEGAQPIYPSLKMSGFSDFNFSGTDLRAPAAGFSQQTLLRPQSGFEEGQFILHFSSALSARVNFFGELSFTARPDAGQGSPAATGFNPEVERAIIRFDQSDYLKLSFGRYHTPINYWNTAFHHGSGSRPQSAGLR